jgi:three-Cys-motif partner protein
MTTFLQKNKDFRVLAFIDPYGMSLNWSSIKALKSFGIDLWILVPTGIGMNRLLTKDGNIREAWLLKLETTLGMERSKIKNYFYKSKSVQTLFGEETYIEKEKNAIEKAGRLYQERLNGIFKYVSNTYPLKNSTGSTMYHFMMASNNKAAFNIANDIIKPKKK